jgi:uncharacterized protein YdaU (DUF1376 family)
MPLYIGDYLADTMRLTTEEHGAYLLLLMEYWRQGPLPNDDKALSGIVKMDRKRWEKELAPVLRSFFILGEDGLLHQKRTDAERHKASVNSAKKQAAANARWDKDQGHADAGGDPSGGANEDAPAHAHASPDASQMNVQQTCPYARVPPSPSPSQKGRKRVSYAHLSETGGFDEWWKAYPLKVGKGKARPAYAKALTKTTHEELLAAVQRCPWNADPRYIPHPTTWLNGERWLDEVDRFDPALRAAGFKPEDFALSEFASMELH